MLSTIRMKKTPKKRDGPFANTDAGGSMSNMTIISGPMVQASNVVKNE
jgi:hypothetical protein